MKDQETINRCIRIRGAQKAARATMETRVALIVAERGITKKQLAKYFVAYRKGAKPRFDHWRFAKDQNISTDWLFDGDLRSHPRGPVPKAARAPVPPRSVLLQEFKDALGKAVDEKGLQFLTSYLRTLADGGAA